MQLHPEKGLNPHLTTCPRCGGEGQEILLLGKHNKIYKCPSCGQTHIGRPKKGNCQKCGTVVEFEREIGESERLPGGFCDACKEEIEKFKKVIAEGGIHWKCEECRREGVITHDAPLAAAVRKKLGIFAPDPCGITFTKEECPVCNTDQS